MYRVFDPTWNFFKVVQGSVPYEQKILLLERNGIALWDVIESCTRVGSRDNNIQAECLNDIPRLLEENLNVRRLIFTENAFRHFKKCSIEDGRSYQIKVLNSTSTLNPNNTFAVLNQWREELTGK
jgi:hypoxanthine-DNA glycosylase